MEISFQLCILILILTSAFYYPSLFTTNDNKLNSLKSKLKYAKFLIDQNDYAKATQVFKILVQEHPQNSKVHFELAVFYNRLANEKQSNSYLDLAINEYVAVLQLPNVPLWQLKKAGLTAADLQSFRGLSKAAIKTLSFLLEKISPDIDIINKIGTEYLILGRDQLAKPYFLTVLEINKWDCYALKHLGFIYKHSEYDYVKAAKYLWKGLRFRVANSSDSKFFFNLGDSLNRLGHINDANFIYEIAAQSGIFLSSKQRSTYNCDGLLGRPWWTLEQTKSSPHLESIRNNWKTILSRYIEAKEVLSKHSSAFENEAEDLSDFGIWQQMTLFMRSKKNEKNCKLVPKTCSLFKDFKEATECTRGQIKFSLMHPPVHVWPHTGPTNCRIRSHLGLITPSGAALTVNDITKTWKEGEIIVFDDSFEHEVWHNGTESRLILIIDMWHPDLPDHHKKRLDPI